MSESASSHRVFSGILLGLGLLVPIGRSWGAPHGGEIMSMEQPDGSSVDVKVWGDEFHVRVEGLDGYTLARDPATGFICYARLNADSTELVATASVYRGAALGKRSSSSARSSSSGGDIPTGLEGLPPALEIKPEALRRKKTETARELGIDLPQTSLPALEPLAKASAGAPDSVKKITGLILLVEFPDVRGTFSRLAVDSMANQPGYNKYSNFGSIRDYWLDISHGKLDYSLVVTQYYLARNNKSYYDRAGGYAGSKELIREALLGLDAKGFDFSGLTTSSAGSVRGLNVLYAGSFGRTWGQGIWPHRGNITSLTLDGVKLNNYQITGLTSSLSIGTIAHENGHLLFNWPDLYDYDSDSRGTGAYCLMSGQNSKNPQPPNAYFRAGQGWDTLVDMKSLQNGLVSIPSNWHKAYKYVNPANTRELFVIESILKKGRWTNVPDEGLLIWHVDENGNNSWQDMTMSRHFRVSVEQADGAFDLERDRNGGGANDLFHYGNNASFGAATSPNSKWWNGAVSGLEIVNISVVKDTMTFQIKGMTVAVAKVPGAAVAPYRYRLAGRGLQLDIAAPGHYEIKAARPDGRSFTLADRLFQAGSHTLDMGTLSKGAYRLSIRGDGRSAASESLLMR